MNSPYSHINSAFIFFLLTLLTVLSPCVTTAQTALSASDRLLLSRNDVDKSPLHSASHDYTNRSRKPLTGIVATVTDRSVISRMEALGLNVSSCTDRYVAGRIERSKVASLAAVEGVINITIARKRSPLNDRARDYTMVDPIVQGEGLPRAYDGKGVIVGLFDIGIDPYHANFLDEDGQTRIARLWHYVHDPETDSITEHEYTHLDPSVFITDTLTSSHGTHVLGTITGSFTSPDMEVDLRGMAPGATPVVACGELYDDAILRGVKRMADYAAEEGMPCVINLSIGNKSGPHDLSDPFTAALDELAGLPGTTIAIAAGNWGCDSVAIVKEISRDRDVRTRLTHLPRASRADSPGYVCEGSIEVWSADATPFTMSVEIVDLSDITTPLYTFTPTTDSITAIITPDFEEEIGDTIVTSHVFDSLFTNSFMAATHQLNEANNRYSAALMMSLTLANDVDPSRYGALLRVTSESESKVYLYVTEGSSPHLSFSASGIPSLDKATVDGTISSLCAGVNSIATGAYVSRKSGYGTVTHRAFFSGYGVLNDGRTRPDILAPGAMVWSSLSGPYRHGPKWTESNTPTVATATVDGKTHYWTTMEGTSMATPVMTGVAALWLSANPNLTSDDIKRIACATAMTPPRESMSRPEYWGSGRLDAYEGLKTVLAEQASVSLPGADNESKVTLLPLGGGEYELFAAEGITEVTLYAPSGISVRSIDAQESMSVIVGTSDLTPGIYVTKVATPTGITTFKISSR